MCKHYSATFKAEAVKELLKEEKTIWSNVSSTKSSGIDVSLLVSIN